MTLSLPMRRRKPRSPGKAPLLFVGAAILAEVLLAGSVVSDRLAPLMALLVGAIGFAAIVRYPLVGMGLVIVLTATFLPSDYLQVQVGSLAVGYHEVALVGVLAAAVAFPRAKTWGGVAGGFLAIFMAILALAALLAISSGQLRFADAVAWGRMFALLLVFYAVVRLFPDRESLGRLMRVAVAAAAFSGFVALIIAFGVDLSPVLGEAATYYVNTDLGLGGIPRIRLPGIALAYPLFWYAALHIPRSRGVGRLGWTLAVLGMTANLALSLNRNMWAGLLVGLAVLMFIGGVRVRRPVGIGVLALVGAVALIAIAGIQVDRGPLAGFAERGQTLFSPEKTTQENSLQDRGKETEQAWRTIKEHPVIGIGPGAEFGVYFDELQPGGMMTYKRTHQLFLHNQYLYLLLICGIPGLLAFLGFLTAAVGRARWHLSDTDISTWAVGVGMIALSAFVMISFADASSALAIGLLCGAIVAATSRTYADS
jgi:O-antigen ligase